MSADWAIQVALFDALSADATLGAITSSIVDFGRSVSDGSAVFPYVAVGDVIVNEFDTDIEDGFDYVARVHSWSNTGSVKQTKDMQSAIYGALHRQDLTVTGWNHILTYRVQSDVMRASSGAFHGVCDYRGLVRYI